MANAGAYAQSVRVRVEAEDAALAAVGRQFVPLCETWYPKIAALLYAPGQAPPPPAEIVIEFQDFEDPKIGGFTQNAVIQLSAKDALGQQAIPHEALVIHELTHVVQGVQVGPQWLYEGIADYIAWTHFLHTNQPYLRVDAKGRLYGYDASQPYLHGLQQKNIAPNGAYGARGIPAGKGYRHGYTVTASFLYWLEQNKRPEIVRELNMAMKTHRYHPNLWRKLAGGSLDSLWKEFLRSSAGR
ncbi:MAG: basic secretory family protein [Bryobacteraceae bacterium]|nr:basic secretory family protein [Bryobacteraceae bacterium]